MNSPLSSAAPNLPTQTDVQRDQPKPICERHQCEKEAWSRAATDPSGGQAIGWRCPKCGEEAIERASIGAHEKSDQERREAEQVRKQAAIEARIGAAGIPSRFREYSFDTFPGTGERAKVHCSTLRSYANRFPVMLAKGINVMLVGGTGTGKTGLACSVANVIMPSHNATALFMTSYGAVRHQRDTWGRRGRTEREALDDLISPDLLILDEVGASVGTDAEMTSFFEVVNGRYAERKPTILLSNLDIEDHHADGIRRPGLRSFLGQRILDRFRDDGSFTLSFDWPSLRGARA
jgi:DNA replication protein DnaC